jgi:hypothetical protein
MEKKYIYIYIYVDFLHDNEMSIVNVEECPTMRIINTVHFKMEVNII